MLMERKSAAISVLYLTILFPCCTWSAPLNLNIKSSLLSHLLKDDGSQNSTTTKKSLLGLDLSGHYDCLLWGAPSKDGRIPLLQQHQHLPVSLALGLQYNFGKLWYGVTKGLATLQYTSPKPPPAFLPSILDLTTETTAHSSAATVGMGWTNHHDGRLSLRVEQSGQAQLSIQLPIHQRLCVMTKTNYHLLPNETLSILGHYNTRIPKQRDWLPDIQLGTLGILTSRSEVGLGRVGLRFMWSRPLGMFGADNDDPKTKVQFQVSSIDRLGQSCASLNIEAVVEQFQESLHGTVLYESHMSRRQ